MVVEKREWAEHRKGINLFGPTYPFFIVSAVYLLIRRRAYAVVLWPAALFLFHEFAPLRLDFDQGTRVLTYYLLPKVPRLLITASIPMAVAIGGALFHRAAGKRGVRLLLLLFLVVSSLVLTWKAHFYYQGSLAQVRAAARYLAAKENPAIYTDLWARLYLRLFSGNRLTRIVQINRDTDIEKIPGPAYVLTGGPRGNLKRFVIWNTLPKRLIEIETTRAPPPKNWEPLRVYPRVKAPIVPGTRMLIFQVH